MYFCDTLTDNVFFLWSGIFVLSTALTKDKMRNIFMLIEAIIEMHYPKVCFFGTRSMCDPLRV